MLRSLSRASRWLPLVLLGAVVALLAVPVAKLHAATLPTAGLLFVGATNTLGNYNEIFFAQEALIQLEKVLGMAGRVYRGFDPTPRATGDTISLRRPSTFVAQTAPSTAQNMNTESINIKLDQWFEVKFELSEKDLSLTAPTIISDHIRPAAVALADKIDTSLCALYKDIPWYTTMGATPDLPDITAIRKVMRDNKVPMSNSELLHLMIGSAEEASFGNKMTALANPQASGLRDGSLGRLYGFDVWANQNTPAHTSGVAADAAGALTVATAIGDSTITFNAVTAAGTFKKGDPIVITGDPQQYAFAADAVADGTGLVTGAAITPNIKQVNNIGAVVTAPKLGVTAKTQNLAFHRNAFCLAMAPLTEMGNLLGARIATISDPITNLSIRSRMYYDGDNSKIKVALDCLWGVKTLDPNLAVRGYQN